MEYIGQISAQAGPCDPWDQPLAYHLDVIIRIRDVYSNRHKLLVLI